MLLLRLSDIAHGSTEGGNGILGTHNLVNNFFYSYSFVVEARLIEKDYRPPRS